MSLIDHPTHEPATEIVPDDAALRAARRERVLAEMELADVDILVIGREANARYVAGVRRLWTAGSRAFGAGCVLMRDGAIHLLSTWDEGVPDDIPREHLYGISFNGQTFLRVLSELAGAADARAPSPPTRSPGRARACSPRPSPTRPSSTASSSCAVRGAPSSLPKSTRSATRSASPSERSR